MMTGSEVTKLVADQGLIVSVPVQCVFATLLGLPIYGLIQNYPEYVSALDFPSRFLFF